MAQKQSMGSRFLKKAMVAINTGRAKMERAYKTYISPTQDN